MRHSTEKRWSTRFPILVPGTIKCSADKDHIDILEGLGFRSRLHVAIPEQKIDEFFDRPPISMRVDLRMPTDAYAPDEILILWFGEKKSIEEAFLSIDCATCP
jgi:hypothetical protein